MTIPKRFALSTLLLVMLLVSLVFGYAQWRRQWLEAEVNEIIAESDPLLRSVPWVRPLQIRDGWFWPEAPEAVGVAIQKGRYGNFIVKGESVTAAEAKEYLQQRARHLHAIGVEKVVYTLLIADNRTTPPKVRTSTLKDLSELDVE